MQRSLVLAINRRPAIFEIKIAQVRTREPCNNVNTVTVVIRTTVMELPIVVDNSGLAAAEPARSIENAC